MLENIAFVLYNTPEYSEKVQVVIKENTLWMTQKAMAELFGVDKSSISRHLKNIFETGELEEKVVVAKIETTTQHGAIAGKTQTTETFFYNQLRVTQEVISSRVSDFCVGDYTFEVGGKKKGKKQISEVPNGYVVRDEIEYATNQIIPLWAFGLMY